MVRQVKKRPPEKDSPMQCHKQARYITTNLKVKVDFTLTALIATNVVTWKFHVDNFAKGRYDVILGQDILIELGLNLYSLNTSSKMMMDL